MLGSELTTGGKTLSEVKNGKSYSIDDRFIYIQYTNERTSIFATVWASYIIMFIVVLITFMIVLAVGYLVNSMAYDPTLSVTQERIIGRNIFDDPRSSVVIQKARDIVRKSNSTKEKITKTKLENVHMAKLYLLSMNRARPQFPTRTVPDATHFSTLQNFQNGTIFNK